MISYVFSLVNGNFLYGTDYRVKVDVRGRIHYADFGVTRP